MIVIVDYGMGNLRSILRKFERMKVTAKISSKSEDVINASKLVLPGVGHFEQAMAKLYELSLVDVLNHRVLVDKVPILGICLGMQLLTKHSEEGDANGLGWLDAQTRKLDASTLRLKIPHMGWNTVQTMRHNRLLGRIEKEDLLFYFAHSYYVSCYDQDDILSTTNYGITFTSTVAKGNILGTQFHPEKSHQSGFQILRNFVELY